MKKSNLTITLTLALLTTVFIFGCAGKKDKDRNFDADLGFRTIVLRVNTADLPPGNKDTEEYCSFPGQPSDVPDSLFTTNVSLGDTILWVGVSTSPPYDDDVSILRIKHHGKDNILNEPVIHGKNGAVIGFIENDGEVEKYSIQFRVTKAGVPGSHVYNIDPKLRIIN